MYNVESIAYGSLIVVCAVPPRGTSSLSPDVNIESNPPISEGLGCGGGRVTTAGLGAIRPIEVSSSGV